MWTYGYDLKNRLVEVSHGTSGSASLINIATYTYDSRDLRVMTLKSGTTTYYQYDQEGDLVWSETSGSTTKYVQALGEVWAEIRTESSVSTTYYHATDHLGSTELITDANGKIVWSANYEPFGAITRSNGELSFSPSFTGKQLDADTGLYYFNARWYDPQLGRFISEDPARDGDNWVAYVGNRPLVYVDPTGLETADPDKVKEEAGVEYGTDYNGNAIESVPFDAQKYADILSIIPGAGDVIDGMMAGQALADGRYADVACYSIAAALPVISGAAAKKGVQFADDLIRKLLNTGDVTVVGDVVRAASKVPTPSGKQFSVAFETKLSPGTFPGKGRGVHFRDANQQLAATMKANPEFTASMEKLIPGISDFLKTPSMASRSPTTLGWTWHHNVETGVMDLVPFSQHTDQLFQNAFHPGGIGGFSIWGK